MSGKTRRHLELNPEVFLLAADIMEESRGFSLSMGTCLAIRLAALRLEGNTGRWNNSIKVEFIHKEFFSRLFREDSDSPLDPYWMGGLDGESKNHRIYALLLAAEVCKSEKSYLTYENRGAYLNHCYALRAGIWRRFGGLLKRSWSALLRG